MSVPARQDVMTADTPVEAVRPKPGERAPDTLPAQTNSFRHRRISPTHAPPSSRYTPACTGRGAQLRGWRTACSEVVMMR